MVTEAVINLGIVGVTCLLLIIYLIRFVFRYKHEYESNPLCTSAVVVCLLVVLVTIFVLPVDIFLVSYIKEPSGALKEWVTPEILQTLDTFIFTTYYTLYAIIIFMIFVLIPFLYFFIGDTESNSNDRFFNAVKYTFGFALVMSLILIIGLSSTSNIDPNTIFSKITQIMNTTRIENALTMLMSIMTIAGFFNAILYTASGIISWPIGLILGTSSLARSVRSLNDREVALRVSISALQERSRDSRLTAAENQQLAAAEEELRNLERDEVTLTSYTHTLNYRMRKVIRPVQMIIGSVFGVLSITLIVTLVLVDIDRILHGSGFKQGYVLLHPEFFNPLDYLYTKLQDLLFIGPMPLLILTCFLVVASISGIRNIGLWFLFARLYRIKIRRTQPEALLFFCSSVMLTALSFNLIMYSMTSEYVTFGSQNYIVSHPNNTFATRPCKLEEYENCILTRSSILIMRMMSQMWVVGAAFYWMSWFFLVVGIMSFLGFLIRGRRNATHGIIVDEDEFED